MPDSADSPELDDLLEQLRQRIENRRREGVYPPGLEDTLDQHFERLVGERPRPSSAEAHSVLEQAVEDIVDYEFSRARIMPTSDLPGGTYLHRAVGKAVSRQVEGVLSQVTEHAALVTRAIALLDEITATLSREFDTKVLQQLDDLQIKVAEQAKAIRRMEGELQDTRERVPGAMVDPWYDGEHFTSAFRGTDEALRERYQGLAQEFVGFDPVLDVGFGSADFMSLLRDLGVAVRGVEVDPALVERARGLGFDAEVGFGTEYLATLPSESLGGLVMLQVVEHLSPQQLIDVVQLIANKVRKGGKVVIETVNPTSLYTYTRAFWLDPDHVRPVSPPFLAFLFQEAGFERMHIDWRSPVAEEERLTLLPGDDDTTRRINENLERLNTVVYGPQDYALIAVR